MKAVLNTFFATLGAIAVPIFLLYYLAGMEPITWIVGRLVVLAAAIGG